VSIDKYNNGRKEANAIQAAQLGGDRTLLRGQQADRVTYGIARNTLKKLTLRKYDPLVNQYVLFNEVKMPSGKKRT
jgi:ribosomal protein L33